MQHAFKGLLKTVTLLRADPVRTIRALKSSKGCKVSMEFEGSKNIKAPWTLRTLLEEL